MQKGKLYNEIGALGVNIALRESKRIREEMREQEGYRRAQSRLPINERDWEWQNYCKHGSYIGDPYGPDYLCPYCEDGIGDAEFIYGRGIDSARRAMKQREEIISAMIDLETINRKFGTRYDFEELTRLLNDWHARYVKGESE